MRHWERIKNRKDDWKIFWKYSVPDHLKLPIAGKLAVYNAAGGDTGSFHTSDYTHLVIDTSIEEYIKILVNDTTETISGHLKHDWFYCAISDKLKKQQFAITGTTTFPRTAYENLITLNGGICKSGVTKNTTHLINSSSEESAKIKKAKEYHVQLITEAEFFKLIA